VPHDHNDGDARFSVPVHKKLAETAEVARKRSTDAEIASKSSVTGEGSTSGAKQLKITTMCSKRQRSEVDEAIARCAIAQV